MSDYTDEARCTACGELTGGSLYDMEAADRHWRQAGHETPVYRTWWGGRSYWWQPDPWWLRLWRRLGYKP